MNTTIATKRAAIMANTTIPAPQWRTIAGITGQFDTYIHTPDAANWTIPTRNRKTRDGQRVTIIRTTTEHGLTTGYTADGTRVYFGSSRTRQWIVTPNN